MSVEVSIKDAPPGKGWPQYGRPVPTEYGHAVEVFMSSTAFDPHCWLRIYDPGRDVTWMQDGYPDEGCDVMAHLTLAQAIAIRDRLTAFIDDREDRTRRGYSA